MTMNVGEPVVAALVAIGELFVVDAHQVHDGGIQVMHMHRILGDVVAKIVGFSVANSTLNTPASHPYRETSRMMITPIFLGREFSL